MRDDLTDATLSLIEQGISDGLRAVSNSCDKPWEQIKKPLQAGSSTYDTDQFKARASLIPESAGRRAPIKHARVMNSALDKAEKNYECLLTQVSLKRLFLRFLSTER